MPKIISYQEFEEADKRLKELQSEIELDVIQEMEMDRLMEEINEFKGKISNFE